MIEIGKSIRKYRKLIGISQAELSRRSGFSKMHLWRVETGKSSPTLDTLMKIAFALNVPVFSLVFLGSSVGEMVGFPTDLLIQVQTAIHEQAELLKEKQ